MELFSIRIQRTFQLVSTRYCALVFWKMRLILTNTGHIFRKIIVGRIALKVVSERMTTICI